jgi:hypothetical protein
MNNKLLKICGAIALSLAHASISQSADIKGCVTSGINIQGVNYYTNDNAFTDVAKLSMGWIRPWGSSYQNIPLDLDQNGYPRTIDAGMAQTIIHDDLWGRDLVNDSDYVLLYEGEGTLDFNLSAPQIIEKSPGRVVVKLKAGRLGLIERQTNPNNYIKNIRLIPLASEQTYNTNKFRSSYLNRWGVFPVWRFMDQLQTNNSKIVNWSDAKKSTGFGAGNTQSLEDIIAFANQANVSPWLNIPHLASDDYIQQMASYVKANLNPKLKVYIEYSNEVWNGQFQQASYAMAQGKMLGIDQFQYYADRSLSMFKIWEQVFGGTDNIVRVIGTQFVNPWMSERILSWKDTANHTDALAIGYYFGWDLGDAAHADQVLMMSADELVMALKNDFLPKAKTYLANQKVVANKYQIPLVAYEAGQHITAVGIHPVYGYLQNYQPLTDKLIAVNRHPMMEDLYQQFYTNWLEIGGGLINWYNSTSSFSKYGSWGLLENGSQDILNAPKYRAVKKTIDGINQATIDSCKTAMIKVPINIPFSGTVLPNGTFTGTLSSGESIGGTILLNPNSPISNSGAAISGTLSK